MRRVLVTGATGFIGAAVARRLVADGYDVAALIRPHSSTWRLGTTINSIHVIHGSLENPGAFEAPLVDFCPDTVMHLAWHGVGKAHRNDPSQIQTNVCGTVNLFTITARAGCKTFVGAGSQAEYGPSRDVLREESPTHPTSLYGAAKLATYMLLSQLATMHGIRFAWLRVFSIFGPQDDSGTLVNYVINELLARRCPAVSEGTQPWDYLYVEDAAAAFVAVGESQHGGAMNVASGVARPLKETVQKLRDAVDPALSIAFGTASATEAAPHPLRASVDRLKQTGWQPAISVDEAIRQTVAWHRNRHSE